MPKSVVYNGCSVGENPLCCFDDLTQEELDFVEQNSVEVEYKRGETIANKALLHHILW